MAAGTRIETDSFGPIEVPADCYWGAQTQRSIENFPFGPNERMPPEIVHALGFVKQAAARVNARIGGLDASLAEAIQQAFFDCMRGDGGSMLVRGVDLDKLFIDRTRHRLVGGWRQRWRGRSPGHRQGQKRASNDRRDPVFHVSSPAELVCFAFRRITRAPRSRICD